MQEENEEEISSEGEEDGEKVTKDAVPTNVCVVDEDEEKDLARKTSSYDRRIDKFYGKNFIGSGSSDRRDMISHQSIGTGTTNGTAGTSTTGVNHWGPSGVCNESLHTNSPSSSDDKPPTEWDLNQSFPSSDMEPTMMEEKSISARVMDKQISEFCEKFSNANSNANVKTRNSPSDLKIGSSPSSSRPGLDLSSSMPFLNQNDDLGPGPGSSKGSKN